MVKERRVNMYVLDNIKDFDLEQTLECGQCFRFHKIDDGHYKVIAYHKILEVQQCEEQLIFHNSNEEEYKEIWESYFDLARDYGGIKGSLLAEDEVIRDAINEFPGVRIINQDFFECLISFIISQNKAIPHIKQIIKRISKAYGTYLGEHEGEELYAFPTPEQLGKATEQDIRDLKAGFRAPYIVDATKKILNGELPYKEFHTMETGTVKEFLLTIKGVGNKVADCVMLFSLGRYEVFPVDVWVKRIMETLYLKEETKLTAIEGHAKELFGHQAGFAQQYLFYYARSQQIGKKK